MSFNIAHARQITKWEYEHELDRSRVHKVVTRETKRVESRRSDRTHETVNKLVTRYYRIDAVTTQETDHAASQLVL